MKKSTLLVALLSAILLIVTGLCIWGESRLSWLHMPRMIIGSIVVLGLPGYWITRWSFPVTENEKMMDPTDEKNTKVSDDEEVHTIDGLERFVLSIALSISAVPLILFYVNFLGVPLSIWSVFFTICGVTLAAMGGTFYVEYHHAHLSK